MKKLPIGIQSIRDILTEGHVYVDKTQFAMELIENGKHYFLSRPRRFGKSLFLSTLKEIFKGNKDLFEGCHIHSSVYDWQPYPVLHLNLAEVLNETIQDFEASLQRSIAELATEHDEKIEIPSAQESLKNLIKALAQKGRVVVLIDEYDKPIIDNLHKVEVAEGNRELLQAFLSTLKSLDQYIKFTFITGISRFSKASLFSGANHLNDITMEPQYAAMMGYTQEEVVQYFDEHIQALAQGRPMTKEEVLEELKAWYNGYRFSRAETHVYNPFSTLNYLDEQKAKSYWYASGTPSFLLREIEQRPQAAVSLSQMLATQSRFSDISRVDKIPLPALMFQTGYLTIQDYKADLDAYQLDFPNQEVRGAFFESILEELTELDSWVVKRSAKQLREALNALELEDFVSIINTHFDRIPYHASQHAREGFYQALFLTFLELSGLHAQGEVLTNKGRIDVVCELEAVRYIFELKVDQQAAMDMDQDLRQEYSQRYGQQGKKTVVMGVSFSSTS